MTVTSWALPVFLKTQLLDAMLSPAQINRTTHCGCRASEPSWAARLRNVLELL